ncbi:hypothetical protein HID58_078847 [Brassica napus]|uniref:Uncharacterized protein n=1 Tax=Brassica napus TaxID=3708 RepID=A0ABQ7YV56_BRANA|nr:hypothetical protein HID58_078847 [Brassica napus]
MPNNLLIYYIWPIQTKQSYFLSFVFSHLKILGFQLERKRCPLYSTQSDKVLSLSFHPTRPWILAGLASGEFKIFDYLRENLIHSLGAHEGAVLGVDFHSSEAIFVTGGEDKVIYGWNYETKTCIFSLKRHTCAVTVVFKSPPPPPPPPPSPWILSASDDSTVCLWNWETQTCVYAWRVGNRPIRCASFVFGGGGLFRAGRDGMLTAAEDDAIRVLDVGCPAYGPLTVQLERFFHGGHGTVNWASIHRNQNLIVSGSKDQVHLWNSRGHTDDVSSVVFHPTKDDIIVSASNDKTLRVWDTKSRAQLHTFHSNNGDRFWSLAAHPHKSLLAA